MPDDEAEQFHNDVLDKIIANPRFYLDNLDYLSPYRYHKSHKKDKKAKVL